MTFRLWLVVLLLLAVTGGGIWNWRQRREIAEAQARVKALEHLAQRPALPSPPSSPAAPPVEVSPPRIVSKVNPPAPSVTAVAPSGPAIIELKHLDPDPRKAEELQKLDALETRATLDRNYASLYLALENLTGVTPAEIEQFKALLAQKREIGLTAINQADLTAPAEAQDWMRDLAAAEDALDEQIRQTIGVRGYSLYQDEKKILPQRKTTELVMQSLTASPEALSASQRDQLAAILAHYPAAGENQSHTEFTSLFKFAVTPSTITDDAIKAAEPFLSPAQLQALQQVQTQQKTQGQLLDWLDRLQRPPNLIPATAP